MRRVRFGLNGPLVPVVGQGTWYFEQLPRRDAVQALRYGLDLGMTHIDTAEMYGDGEAEEIVGEAIAGRRGDAFLVSKVLPWNASFEGTVEACERSLRRLGTDYLDSYLLHWPGQVPLEETMAALSKLKEEGKIRSFGVSNFDVDDLEEALALVGEGALACNQVLYHLESRGIEHGVLPWCARHGVSVVAYSPFGHGAFPMRNAAGWAVLTALAGKHGASEGQVVLAFLARHENVMLIPKSSDRGHLEDNAAAGALVLDAHDIERLEMAFPLGEDPGYLAML